MLRSPTALCDPASVGVKCRAARRGANRRDAGLRADVVGIAPGRPRHADAADERALGADHQPAADRDDARQLADARRRPAGLRRRGELGGVGAE